MSNKPTPEGADEIGLAHDLEAYDNPQAYADPQNPHVYTLRIPGKPYSESGAVLRIQLDGAQLKSALRALMTVALNRSERVPEKDLEQYLASEIYH